MYQESSSGNQQISHVKILVRGIVQGVGFRPFVYNSAISKDLKGWVRNCPNGLEGEVEGPPDLIEKFIDDIKYKKPPHARIDEISSTPINSRAGFSSFKIEETLVKDKTSKGTQILPDLATCSDCLKEILNPKDRRYRYPFTTCTFCGPRYSIIDSLPYDRERSTMVDFPMCEECLAEYKDPLSRRFHAQSNACPKCGPQLSLWDKDGTVLAKENQALLDAASAIKAGAVLALKGLGGFMLMADARSDAVTAKLRERKVRPTKPLALMFPHLEGIKKECSLPPLEQELLCSPAAPIVLLDKLEQSSLCKNIAPGMSNLGVMLPYTPLHHLLMQALDFPVIATSGNISEEPICINEEEALEKLSHIADYFLLHNRRILHRVDDSVVHVIASRSQVIRLARGYAPYSFSVNKKDSIIATGAHLKNTIAICEDKNAVLSQHIGDLEALETLSSHKKLTEDLRSLYGTSPQQIACDKHPAYVSTQNAEKSKLKTIQVQHHYAHILSCMEDNNIAAPVLGVTWDGSGYGDDATIWGGEFLSVDGASYKRIAYFSPFKLPGGEEAIRNCRRCAVGLLYEIFGEDISKYEDLLEIKELKIILSMLAKDLNTPKTSSAGRLFDAAAALLGICTKQGFEGHAAMLLEAACKNTATNDLYDFQVKKAKDSYIILWDKLFIDLIQDQMDNKEIGFISAKFHNTLVEIIIAIAKKVDIKQVALSGGCFQNKYLSQRTIKRLRDENFQPFWHHKLPANDGGIAVGQIKAALLEN